jgi:hypothetical protein
MGVSVLSEIFSLKSLNCTIANLSCLFHRTISITVPILFGLLLLTDTFTYLVCVLLKKPIMAVWLFGLLPLFHL